MDLKQVVTRTAVFGAAAAGIVMVGAGSATAAADSANSDISVRAGSVVLTPAPDGGYIGQLPVRVRYEGPEDANFDLAIDHPEGLYLQDGTGLFGCLYSAPKQGAADCGISPDLAPGETRTITITYKALAPSQVKTRLTTLGSVTVTGRDLLDATPHNNTAKFRGALRGTGVGIAPGFYQPAPHADMALRTTAGTLSFTPLGEGSYRAVAPATVSAKTDAFHQDVAIELVTPVPGLSWIYLDPMDACGDRTRCPLDIGKLPQGASRDIQLGLDVTTVPPAGTVLEFRVLSTIGDEYDTDANPTDNTISLVVA